jgi:tetratricopeptide (TPR) repeat protein
VIGLTAGAAVVLGGLAYTAAMLMQNSGSDLARMGDKMMAAGEFRDAADTYAKAVHKEKTNTEFLRKWIEAQKKTTRDTQRAYSDAFVKELASSVRQLALVSDQIGDKRAFLDMRQQLQEGVPFSKDLYDDLINDINTMLQQYPTPTPESDGLRRYRGMACLRIALNTPDASQELIDGAKEDLEAALAANPADADVAEWLSTWYTLLASKAATAQKLDEANALMGQSEKVINDFIAKNPQDAQTRIMHLKQELDRVARGLMQKTPRATPEEARAAEAQFSKDNLPKLEETTELAKAQAGRLPVRSLMTFRFMEASIDPAAVYARTESLARAVQQARPVDADVTLLLSDMATMRGDSEGAYALLQKVVEMPVPPLSVEGQLLFSKKNEAMVKQGQALFQSYKLAKTDEDSKKAVVRMRALRDQLATQIDASHPGLLLTDAELAIMDGDLSKADRLLAQFNRDTRGMMAESLLLAADVSILRNQPGAAKDHLEALLRVNPRNVVAAGRLAEVEILLKNYGRAEDLLVQIQKVQPDNKSVAQQLQLLKGINSGEKVDDPVVQLIMDADKESKTLADDPTAPGKIVQMLRDGMARLKSTDARLFRAIAMAEVRNNNKPGALEVVRQGLTANPGNAELKYFEVNLAATDPLKMQEELNALRAAGDKVEEQIGLYNIYREHKKPVEARAALEAAKALAPNDKRVIELEFLAALEAKDFTKAEELATRAQREDVDGAGGDVFRARLQSAKGNGVEAVTLLEGAVAKGALPPETWRLLGHMQLDIGRGADALASFRQALALRPDDLGSIKDLLRTQVRLGMGDEALNTARANEQFGSIDADFVHLWLNLEASVQGGNRQKAMTRRAALYRINPGDRDNAIALAAIYMDTQREAARPIIDSLMQSSPGLDVVNLDAGWHWAQRDFPKARAAFETFISEQEKAKKLSADAFVVYAQFLMQRQDVDGALAVLERARSYQDPKTADVDRAIADTCMSINRLDQAAEACRRIMAAKADTANHIYEKRLAECYTLQGKLAEASALLEPMMAAADVDAMTFLLGAEVKNQQKDANGRMKLLDTAVARFPGEAAVFLKRGQAMLETVQGKDLTKEPDARAVLRNAVADLDQAYKLNPQLWQALRLRAMAHKDLSEPEKAISDLKAALDINPFDNDLLQGLVAYMLENAREQEALEVADRALQRRNRDIGAHMMVASVFSAQERWSQAVRYMERAFTIEQSEQTALRYLDMLLSAKPKPMLADAERVLNAASIKPKLTSSPGLLMAQARLLMAQEKKQLAVRTAADALGLIKPDDFRTMFQWLNEMRRIVPAENHMTFLSELAQAGVASEWMTYFRGMLMSESVPARDQGVDLMRQLLKQTQNKVLRQFAYRSLTGSLYSADRFPEAASEMKAALLEFPDDLEIMNNLAYTLVKRLNAVQEALPLAEKVAEKNPTPDVLDTLGLCYLMTGQKEKSLATLARAEGMSMRPVSAVSVLMHKAEALEAMSRLDEARKALADAAKIAENNPAGMTEQAKKDLEEARKRIGTP